MISEEDLICFKCHKRFTLKREGTEYERVNYRNVPCVLDCGHSVCHKCINDSGSTFYCSVCKTDSFTNNTTTHYHLFGCISASTLVNKKLRGYEGISYSAPTLPTTSDFYRLNTCVSCNEKKPSFECDQCGVFCSRCLELVHNLKSAHKNHSVNPLQKVMSEEKCSKHNEVLKFFCETDKEMVCVTCPVREHSGHAVVEFDKWKESNTEFLRSAVTDSETVIKSLRQSISHIEQNLKNLEHAAKTTTSDIKKEFISFHGLLQIFERQVLDDFCKKVKSQIEPSEKMLQDLKNQLTSVMQAAEAGKDALNESLNTDYFKLKPLLNIRNIPCYLEQSQHSFIEFIPRNLEDFKKIVCDLLKDRYSTLIKTPECNFDLKCFSDIPEDVKTLPAKTNIPALTMIPKLIKSSTVSPLPGPSLQQPSFKRPELRKRGIDESKLQIVKVVHINNPHDFYVQFETSVKLVEEMETELDSTMKNSTEESKDFFKGISNELKLDKLTMFDDKRQRWVRCRVINRDVCDISCNSDQTSVDSNFVDVVLLDYGEQKRVPVNGLRELPEKFQETAEKVVQCSLHQIQPINLDLGWSENAIAVFKKYVLEKFNYMTIREKILSKLIVDLVMFDEPRGEVDHRGTLTVRDFLVFSKHAHFETLVLTTSVPSNLTVAPVKFPRLPPLKLNSEWEAQVVHCTSLFDFYIQLQYQFQNIERLTNDIAALNLDSKELLNEFHEGTLCFAKYDFDDRWYRAVILQVIRNDSIEVRYVDFGNEGIVTNQDIRQLNNEFCFLPEMAVRCSLAGIKLACEQSTEEANDSFLDLVDDQIVTLRTHKYLNKALHVTLYRAEDKARSINHKLVNNKICISDGSIPLTREFPEATNDFKLANPGFGDFNLDGQNINLAYDKKICICHVESPSCIYVRWLAKDSCFQRLHEELSFDAKIKSKNIEENTWQVGDKCSFFNEDKQRWMRAILLSIEENETRIFHMDVGTSSIEKTQSLFKLSKTHQELNPLAFRCHLYGITPAGGNDVWSSLSMSYLLELNTFKELYLVEIDEEVNSSLPIEIIGIKYEVPGPFDPRIAVPTLFANYLVEKGVAVPIKTRKRLQYTLTSQKTDTDPVNGNMKEMLNSNSKSQSERDLATNVEPNDEVKNKNMQWKKDSMVYKKGQTFEVKVVEVTGIEIACHVLPIGLRAVEEVNEMIQTFVESKSSFSENIFKQGDAVIAQFSNGKWYRAEIISISDEEDNKNYIVEYIDYGNRVTVTKDKIRVYNGDAFKIPRLGLMCQLHDVLPVSSDCTKFLGDKLLNNLVSVTVVNLPTKLSPMTVHMSFNGENVQKMLINSKKAQRKSLLKIDYEFDSVFQDAAIIDAKISDGPKIDIPIGALLKLKFIRNTAPNLFFAEFSKNTCSEGKIQDEVNKYLNLLESISAKLSKQAPLRCSIESADVNDEILSGYSIKRQKWVRICCEKVIDKECILGFLVDYGDLETFLKKNVQVIPKSLVSQPRLALSFCLHQVMPCAEDWNKAAIIELENIYKNKICAVMKSTLKDVVQVDLFADEDCRILSYQSLIDKGYIMLQRNEDN